MAPEKEVAHPCTNCIVIPHPESPTLGVLRMDTPEKQHWFLVTKRTLLNMAALLQQAAEDLQDVQ